jgi:hypothetical protein
MRQVERKFIDIALQFPAKTSMEDCVRHQTRDQFRCGAHPRVQVLPTPGITLSKSVLRVSETADTGDSLPWPHQSQEHQIPTNAHFLGCWWRIRMLVANSASGQRLTPFCPDTGRSSRRRGRSPGRTGGGCGLQPRSNGAVAPSPRSAPASSCGYGVYAGNATPRRRAATRPAINHQHLPADCCSHVSGDLVRNFRKALKWCS